MEGWAILEPDPMYMAKTNDKKIINNYSTNLTKWGRILF